MSPIRSSRALGYGVSVLRLVEVVLRGWKRFVFLPIVGAAVAASIVMVGPPTFTAESRFTIQSEAASLSLAPTLAAQFGLALQGPMSGTPLWFYVELIRSRDVQVMLLETQVEGEDGEAPVPLRSLLDEGDSGPEGLETALDELNRRVAVFVEPQANLVTVRTTFARPQWAERVNRRITEIVDLFNMEIRQTQAGAERVFAEARLAERRSELLSAEDALRDFLVSNRSYEASPELRLMFDRLNREVDARQTVVNQLMQSLEEARLREVRDVPTLTIVDRPEGSALRDQGLGTATTLGVLAGVMAATLWTILAEFLVWHARERSEEYVRLLELAMGSRRRTPR